MPLLIPPSRSSNRVAQQGADVNRLLSTRALPGGHPSAILPRCANPACASSWMRLWRSRTTPVFEQGWCCSPECTRARINAALNHLLAREGEPAVSASYRHRIPLGLSMLEKGWITSEQLRNALDAQRAAGCGKLGQWLLKTGAVNEQKLTRALALQWSCPVLRLDLYDPGPMAALLPRLFVDALDALPLRVAAQRILYLCSEDRPDPVLAMALETMSGLRVEAGVAEGSLFRQAHVHALNVPFASVELLEVASASAMLRVLANAIEKSQPVESRLVRVHDFVWMRMWSRAQNGVVPRREDVRDLICSLSSREKLSQ